MVATETRPASRPNRYRGNCRLCGIFIPEGRGQLGPKVEGKFTVECSGGCGTTSAAPAAPTSVGFAPTAEQQEALALFATGASMVIEAGAGTGKTSTLRLLAHSTSKRGRYLAFNKAIVEDTKGTMPDNVICSTAHSLAFQAVGKQYARRLKAGRMRSSEIARHLGIDRLALQVGDGTKILSEDYLGGLVMRAITNFCQSADERPAARHFPYIDGIDPHGEGGRSYDNNNLVARELTPALERAWSDLTKLDGILPFKHDHYLKLWQLSHPRIECDFLLFDEAQDANPVLLAVVQEQEHAQRVLVGDAQQAIYEFTGAVNAIEDAKQTGWPTATLSQSFRFGPAIANAANALLVELEATLRLTGLQTISSSVGEIEGDPDAILCRTNAAAVDAILSAQQRGISAHLVGGGDEVLRFAEAAEQLQERRPTNHPELACFNSWGEVLQYVEQDEQGDELKLNVALVEKYGVPTIRRALAQMPREDAARLTVSTAHKSKGREWGSVKLAGDFVKPTKPGEEQAPPSPGELRLQYVACTRAKMRLDNTVLTAEPPSGE